MGHLRGVYAALAEELLEVARYTYRFWRATNGKDVFDEFDRVLTGLETYDARLRDTYGDNTGRGSLDIIPDLVGRPKLAPAPASERTEPEKCRS